MGKTPLRQYGGVVRTSIYSPQNPFEQMVPFVVSRVNGGMDATTDAADIAENAVADAKNHRVRYDKTLRRPGTEAFGEIKPDSVPVLALYSFKANDGVGTLLRFTENGIHRDPDNWTAIAGTLNGNAANRFSIATAFNQVVFSNGGVDEIQVIDLSTDTFAALGNAERYKFITVFANRVFGLNYRESGTEDPVRLGWSANGLITEWDPLTDITAGFATLTESPGDLSDFGTGIFGFTNVMIILKERSIWLATKTGISTAPVNPVVAVPGIGCGCPYSAAIIPGGLCFADHRTEKVYAYTPGQQPIAISTQVERELFRAIQNPEAVFGSYDNRTSEYALAVPLAGSTLVRVWIYNIRTQAWTYDERENLSCISDIEGAAQELTIDELPGTIDALVGTIDELVGDQSSATSRLYGFGDGDIELERQALDSDAGTEFTTRLTSRTFYLPVTDHYVARLRYEVICRQNTTFRLYYSRDGGKNWVLSRTDIVGTLNEPYLIVLNKQIKCRKFSFKIETDNGDWDILDYEIHTYRSGESQATNLGLV